MTFESVHSLHHRIRSDGPARSTFTPIDITIRSLSLANLQQPQAPVQYSVLPGASNLQKFSPKKSRSSSTSLSSRLTAALRLVSKLEAEFAEDEKIKIELGLRKIILAKEKEKFLEARFRCQQLQAHIEQTERKLGDHQKLFGLLDELGPYIPGVIPYYHKLLWVSEDSDKIIDHLKVVSKRRGSRWKLIVDGVVDPLDDYIFQINGLLRLRKKARDYSRIAKEARKAHPDVEELSPDMFVVEEPADTLADERNMRVVDDMLDRLKRGELPKQGRPLRQVHSATVLELGELSYSNYLFFHPPTTIDSTTIQREGNVVDDVLEALKRGDPPPRTNYPAILATVADNVFTSGTTLSTGSSISSSSYSRSIESCTDQTPTKRSSSRAVLGGIDTNSSITDSKHCISVEREKGCEPYVVSSSKLLSPTRTPALKSRNLARTMPGRVPLQKEFAFPQFASVSSTGSPSTASQKHVFRVLWSPVSMQSYARSVKPKKNSKNPTATTRSKHAKENDPQN